MTSPPTGSTVPRTEPSLWTRWTAARKAPAPLGSFITVLLRGENIGRANVEPGFRHQPSTEIIWEIIKQELTRINRTEDTHTDRTTYRVNSESKIVGA